jgi:hypothetical protein
MHANALVDIVGWLGAVALLLGYGFVSTKKVEGDSTAYQLMNMAGGACLTVNTIYYGAFPSASVNIIWIGIALYALSRRATRAGNRRKAAESLDL